MFNPSSGVKSDYSTMNSRFVKLFFKFLLNQYLLFLKFNWPSGCVLYSKIFLGQGIFEKKILNFLILRMQNSRLFNK